MQFGSLRDVLDNNPKLSSSQRLKLAKDAAKGMVYLHSRKVIHRDLKTQNLLVNANWECKVADFGISTVKENKTQIMTCIGTPIYMAPEVLVKAKYSEKADVFSFGILLTELYSGKVPYSDTNLGQHLLMDKIINDGLRPDVSSFPDALRELILDCWNIDPKLRPSFAEILVRLRRMRELKTNHRARSFRNYASTSIHASLSPFSSLDNMVIIPPDSHKQKMKMEAVIENLRNISLKTPPNRRASASLVDSSKPNHNSVGSFGVSPHSPLLIQ